MDEDYNQFYNQSFEEQKYQAILNNRVISTAIIQDLDNSEAYFHIENQSDYSQISDSPFNAIPQVKIPCSICQMPPSTDLIFLESCDHFFCNQCLFEYLKIRIEESQVLTMPCPYDQCHSQILDFEIKQIVSSELYNKYIRFKNVEALNKQPFLKWCPKPDCEGYDVGSLQKSKLKCNVCGYIYCFYCGKVWHRWRKCKFSEDKEMDKWAKENGIKYCPNCKRKVEKLMGCEHLTCPICEYEWCWVCGDKYTPGHLCNIEVKVELPKLPLFIIIVLILGPCIFLMIGFIVPISTVYEIRNGDYVLNEKIKKFIMNYKKISYFLAIISAIFLNPLTFLISFYKATYDWVVNLKLFEERRIKKHLFCILIYPFFFIFTAFIFTLLPIVGIVLLIFKIYLAVKVYKDPRYISNRNQYGYN